MTEKASSIPALMGEALTSLVFLSSSWLCESPFGFFFNDTATTEIYTLSLHDALPISIPLQQLNGLETLVIIMVANKYAFLQITRRRFLNEWEAFKKVISRRNIRRRITIPLTLSNLKLLRRITRTENILHR